MAKIFWSIGLLVIVLSTGAFNSFITKLVELISNINKYVVTFVPSELLFVFVLLGFGLGFKAYQSLKN